MPNEITYTKVWKKRKKERKKNTHHEMITQAGQKPSALLGLHVFALESCNMLIFTDNEKEIE